MGNISSWSTSAGANNDASPDGWPEGMPPSGVNDSARENMAAVARWYQDVNASLESTGSGGAYVLTTKNNHAAAADMAITAFRSNHANTSSATLNVDGNGAIAIKKNHDQDLDPGDIESGQICVVLYDGTFYQLLSPIAKGANKIEYLKYSDVKAKGTNGGTFTAGSYVKRDLNTEDNDDGGHGSLASSVLTLAAGTYRFSISAPALACDSHRARLQNTSDSTSILGTSEYSDDGATFAQTRSFVVGELTIASSKNFEIQHICSTTRATNGLGFPLDNTGESEVYTVAEFWKIS